MKPNSILILFAVFSLAHVIHAKSVGENPIGQFTQPFESIAKEVGAGLKKGAEKIEEGIKAIQNKTQEIISKYQERASNLGKGGLPSLPPLGGTTPAGAPPASAPPAGAPPAGAPPAGAPPAGAPPAGAPPAGAPPAGAPPAPA